MLWRGKRQKVYQSDFVMAGKFHVEKVYVVPGDLKTFIYGPCVEYRILKDA